MTTQTVFDRERDHYLLVLVGTDGVRKVHGVLVHIDIVGDRVLIQRDGTERGMAAAAGARRDRERSHRCSRSTRRAAFLYSELDDAA